MTAPIPHDQLEIGKQIWIVSKNLDWLVEFGVVISLPDFEKPYVEYKNRGGFYHKILNHYKVFDNEGAALRKAVTLLEKAKNEVYEKLLEINQNIGERA